MDLINETAQWRPFICTHDAAAADYDNDNNNYDYDFSYDANDAAGADNEDERIFSLQN